MKNRNLTHHDNWATPKGFYDLLNKRFEFNFDPCPLRYEPVTPETDGLLIEWGTRNFINPPYSLKLKEAFIKKAVEESHKGKLCVMLLPVSTSTKVFHEVIIPNASEIILVKGRVGFIGYNHKGELTTDKSGSPQHDSMVVIFNGKRTFSYPSLSTISYSRN